MELNPYLVFKGDCAQAFTFYAQILGGRIVTMQKFGETPACDHVPPDWRDRVLHAHLVVGEKSIMGSDPPPPNYEAPQGVSVTVSVASPTEAERIFTALAENGKVTMPFQKTFWSPAFGMTVDRFGIPWIVNCDPQPA